MNFAEECFSEANEDSLTVRKQKAVNEIRAAIKMVQMAGTPSAYTQILLNTLKNHLKWLEDL